MSDSFSNPTPQFGTAEYAKPGSNRCQGCQQPIGGTYYLVNTAMVCPSCVEQLRGEMKKDTHAAFVRAVAYGIGAALAGLIGYALIAIVLQGWVISYMSIGVGWLVGTAMIRGSNGAGGRRYQIVAALLTYAAVSMAAIPIGMHFASEQSRQRQVQQQKIGLEQRQLEQESGLKPSGPQSAIGAARPPADLGTWVVRLAMLGLASPFYELAGNPFWGVMGLLILFFGIRIAWKMTAGQQSGIRGPFAGAPTAAA